MNIWKLYMWTAEWRIIWRKIIDVIYATYAIAKRKPEKKIQACTGFEPLTSAIPVRRFRLFQASFSQLHKLGWITAMIFLQIIYHTIARLLATVAIISYIDKALWNPGFKFLNIYL